MAKHDTEGFPIHLDGDRFGLAGEELEDKGEGGFFFMDIDAETLSGGVADRNFHLRKWESN